MGKIWSEDDTKPEPEIPDSELKNVKKDNSAMKIVDDGNTEKEYTSMYEELNEKCHPKNFMNPFDELKVKTANSIYSKLIGLGEGNIQELRELRNLAIEHLGISFSTQSVYKKLMEYCNPSIYFSINPYPSEWIDKATAYYARIENAKDDLLELEKIEEESKDLYEWYRKVIWGETTEENEGNSDAVVSDNKEPIIVDSVGEDYKKEPDKSPTPTKQPKGGLITLIILLLFFALTGIIISFTSDENTTDEYDVEPISVSTNMENTDSVQHRSKGSMDVVAVNSKENIGGYEFVDLGLSVKWATCNIGAGKPEEYGDYYAWGETFPKSIYRSSTYKYCKGSSSTLTKYCTDSKYGTVDYQTTLEKFDDVAYKTFGGKWRIPTDAEWTELRMTCKWTWATVNGVNGYKVKAKNGNSIFLPAAGYRFNSDFYGVGYFGEYWSSSLNESNSSRAWYVIFNSDYVRIDYDGRYNGLSVRPVLGSE